MSLPVQINILMCEVTRSRDISVGVEIILLAEQLTILGYIPGESTFPPSAPRFSKDYSLL